MKRLTEEQKRKNKLEYYKQYRIKNKKSISIYEKNRSCGRNRNEYFRNYGQLHKDKIEQRDKLQMQKLAPRYCKHIFKGLVGLTYDPDNLNHTMLMDNMILKILVQRKIRDLA